MGLRRSLRGFLDAVPARPLPPQLRHAPPACGRLPIAAVYTGAYSAADRNASGRGLAR